LTPLEMIVEHPTTPYWRFAEKLYRSFDVFGNVTALTTQNDVEVHVSEISNKQFTI